MLGRTVAVSLIAFSVACSSSNSDPSPAASGGGGAMSWEFLLAIALVVLAQGRKKSLAGLRIDWEPKALRHFTARFAPIDSR